VKEMRHPYFVADVFTDSPLAGNQVAVFTEGRNVADDRMQAVAREMNLSETVFVLPPARGGHSRLRIFTPRMELPFAGHPILGTAFVLGEMDPTLATADLETGSGTIPVELERRDGSVVLARLEQEAPSSGPYAHVQQLMEALRLDASALPAPGSPAVPIHEYRNGPGHVYVELADTDAVVAVKPDMGALEALGPTGANCFAGSGRSWKTRMFAPGAGVPEDPATGSAAGPLALHLARHGRIAFGEEIEIRQGTEIGRPSVLYATAYGSADNPDRVAVSGSAVVVAEGTYRLD
jgi:trans-2,3-dihydro-3-hydroxyanthranilate isomerase